MQEQIFRPRQAFTVGEVFNLQAENLGKFIGDNGNFSTIFDFGPHEHVCGHCAYYAYEKLSVAQLREEIFKSQRAAADYGFLAPVIENHDEPRGVSCYLPPMWHNSLGAKALGTISMLLRGIPFIYQGQELGMLNTRFNSIEEFQDLQSKEEYRRCLRQGLSVSEALDVLNAHARDHARTPMPWNEGPHAGFTSGTPWMRLQQDYQQVNVKAQLADADSVLRHYQKLVSLKKDPALQTVLTYGSCTELNTPYANVIAYTRKLAMQSVVVAANFDEGCATLTLTRRGTLRLTSGQVFINENQLTLQPGSSAVLVLA